MGDYDSHHMYWDANSNKYMEYKKMCDYHMSKCEYYKGHSKKKYMKHYKSYRYYYAKMMACGKKSWHDHGHHHHDVCETHTHYKHYHHHHHIEKHYHHCKDSSSC